MIEKSSLPQSPQLSTCRIHLPRGALGARPDAAPVGRLRIELQTPTEIKGGDQVVGRPEFGTLFARARDRVSALRGLYREGPLPIDFRAMGERAAAVCMTNCELRHVQGERRSGRTGQVHPLGGFIGVAGYEGN